MAPLGQTHEQHNSRKEIDCKSVGFVPRQAPGMGSGGSGATTEGRARTSGGAACFRFKEVELISLALECASPNLDEAETRRHVRAALAAGATREEILHVIECAFALAVRSCGLGASILIEEMKAAGVTAAGDAKTPPPPRCEARHRPVELDVGLYFPSFRFPGQMTARLQRYRRNCLGRAIELLCRIPERALTVGAAIYTRAPLFAGTRR